MKRILYTICIGSLALAFAARGAEINDTTKGKGKKAHATASVQATTSTNTGASLKAKHSMNTARVHQRTAVAAHTTSSPVVNHHLAGQAHIRATHQANLASANVQTNNAVAVSGGKRFRSHSGNLNVNQNQNLTVNRNNLIRQRNIVVTNNWSGSSFSGQPYVAFRTYHRQWHDRNWWGSRYNRIVFVSGGWYYWNDGFWFPAYGYASNSYYPYDGPIYGYNGYSPDRVIVEVQTQLQRDGYYAGGVDGVLGPRTRRAIALFQADHGLAVTASVDEPTLETLGLS